MKSAIVCYKCKMFKKYLDSYAVKIEEWGENGGIRKVRMCRTCVKRMGYRVRVKNVKIKP